MHSGNKRFRTIVESHFEQYATANSRIEKSIVVSSIVDEVREKGEFVRTTNGEWVVVSDRIAREKCGQGLRDRDHSRYNR